ncbi:serine/threonine-protein kinase [Streptomyces sp. NPDC051569]|uniref:serine/threonine-protein kinase n=1 Tax=Streptomyces sp. NPDC051569 TaxID=3365661 RepID=UPI0037A2FB1D
MPDDRQPDDPQPADRHSPDRHSPDRHSSDSRLIAGRYRLGARLGRGGMGTVWVAHDELLGRRVAVKELHAAPGGEGAGGRTGTGDSGARHGAATLREAQAVARVKHPHVVVVHDVVEEDGRPYIVMELVEGGSLADRIAARGPLEPAEAVRIALALLGALRAAHGLGVLHRDLKPANVLLEEGTGRVVLTDFGIARLVGSTTITDPGAFVGSPEYTAPERVLDSERAGPASDLWSLGALLCAMLTGESPFHRESLAGVLHAVVEAEIRPPAIAESLLPVVRGLLERDPARRLDAGQAERLLRAYGSEGATSQHPAATPGGRRTGRGSGAGPRIRVGPRIRIGSGIRVSGSGTGVGVGTSGSGVGAGSGGGGGVGPVPARRRTALVAGALVAVVAGAGAVSLSLFPDGGEGRGGHGGSSAPPVPAGPGQSSGPTTVGTPVSALPAGEAPGPAPAGYRAVNDPMGFTLAVPEGFTRSHDDERVYYVSADRAFRVGIRIQEPIPGGPTAAMRLSDAEGADTNPGYRDGSVTPTTHNGFSAALWEFTWNGFTRAEGARHTFDLCWDENGRMYDVWVSSPVDRLDESRGQFDTALDSFVPLPTPARPSVR